jgi:hypothetical protein
MVDNYEVVEYDGTSFCIAYDIREEVIVVSRAYDDMTSSRLPTREELLLDLELNAQYTFRVSIIKELLSSETW